MAVWSDSSPADTILANTLHTVTQAAKSEIAERMKARSSDNTIDEHNVCQSGEDGLHLISKVGFVKQHSTVADMQSWLNTNGRRPGSMHLILTTGYPFYIVDEGGDEILAITSDHSLLANLTAAGCHTGLLTLDGSRAMAGYFVFASGKTCVNQTYGSGDSDALNPTHISQTWYDAHGADMLQNRHFVDATLEIDAFNGKKTSGSYVEDAVNDAHGIPTTQSTSKTDVYMGRDGTGSYLSPGAIPIIKEAST